MIICISGLHGTGKSEVGKRIASQLNIKYYSTGEAFRQMAKEENMTLEEFTNYVEENPEIDKKLDNLIIKIAQKGDTIIDSQLSSYILKDIADFKILLTCPLETRVKRMSERDKISYEKSMNETLLREKSEQERFKMLYNIDLRDNSTHHELFNIILNTEHLTIDQVVNQILELIKKS